MRLLWFNLATDADDPVLGFASGWIEAIAKRVDFIYVITMRTGRYKLPKNVLVYSVGKEKGYSEPRRVVEFYRYLFRVLSQDHIDACFCHMIPIFTVLASPMFKAKRIPVVTWYLHPSLTSTLKLAHHLSDRILTALQTSYPYRKDKVIVVGHGIDMDIFCPDGSPPEAPPMILCVGRLSPVKDHPTLLKATALLRKRFKQAFRVVILGGPLTEKDRKYVRNLQDMVKELGLQDCIQFIPPVPHIDLPSWYRRCIVHVNLTPTGFADKVVFEAMACSRLSLVANESFRDTMGAYADLLIFRHGDAGSLEERLLWSLTLEEKEMHLIQEHLRQQVIQKHSLNRLADRLIDILQSLRKSQSYGTIS